MPRRLAVPEDYDEEIDADEDVEMRDDSQVNISAENIQQMARKLVRYALSCEFSRTTIKRQDITAKVMTAGSRQFKDVFSEAQMMLRETFGMEMVELPKAEKLTQQQRRAAQKTEKPASIASNVWILVSTLPEKYRTAEIISPTSTSSVDKEPAYIALYTFIITIIYLSGGSVEDNTLEKHLERVQANDETPIDSTDKLLLRLIKDGYIAKARETKGHDELVEYYVGPRGKVEVGPEGAKEFVKTVMLKAGAELKQLEDQIDKSFAFTTPEEKSAASQMPQKRGPKKRSRNEHDTQVDSNNEADMSDE